MSCFHRKETATPSGGEPLPVIFSSLRAAHNRQLDQLDAAARKLLLDTYRRLKPELVGRLKALDADGKATTFEAQHLALIKLQVEDALAAWAPAAAEALTALTTQTVTFGATTAIAEVAELEKRFDDAERAARIEALPPTIPADQVARIADDQKLLLREFADEAVNGTVRGEAELPGIAAKLAESVTLGESIPKAAKRLGQALDAEAYKLKRIARTEIANAANASHDAQIEAVAIAFPEMGLKKQWSAETCSPRTCPVCQDLDGQVVGANDFFVYAAGKVTWRGKAPPQHPNCRCRVNAYRAEWAVKPAKAPPKHHPRLWRTKEQHMALTLNRRQRRLLAKGIKAPNGQPLQHQAFEFKADQVNEDGTFEGYLSVFGNEDRGGDVVVKGAFLDTLRVKAAKGRKFPLLWYHDPTEPVGVFTEMREDEHGLWVKGQLNMKVKRAEELHALLKQGAVDSMSIGYSVPKGGSEFRDGKRYLKKVDLWEGSLVTFAMNEDALVTGVKAADWQTTYELEQREMGSWTERWRLFDSITCYICGLVIDREMERQEKLAAFDTSMEQFHEALRTWFEDALDLEDAEREAGMKGDGPDESKAGRRHSAATLAALEKAMGHGSELCAILKGLMPKKDDEEPDPGDAGDDEPDETAGAKGLAGLVGEMKLSNWLADLKAIAKR